MGRASIRSLHVQEAYFRAKEELISMKAIRTAQQMTVEEIATVAATGVARTLDARQAAGVALSSEELSQVHGGLTLISVSTWGMVPPPLEG
jgi:hypothetical protein